MPALPWRWLLVRQRLAVLAGLAGLTLLAWSYLLLGAGMDMAPMAMDGRMTAMTAHWTAAYAGLVLLMWAAMMLAMMLPAAAPVILLVSAAAGRRGEAARAAIATPLGFTLGYLAVWLGFSVFATVVQWGLAGASLLAPGLTLAAPFLAGPATIAAGLYQLTPLKQACLRHCRSPLDVLLLRWRPGLRGAFAGGFLHGLFCLGCCWMLMALLFVSGLMNLLWIAFIAILVLAEKALPWGERTSRLAGLALVVWGVAVLRAAA